MKKFTKLLAALFVLFITAAFIGCDGANSSTPDERHDVVFDAPEVDQGGGSYVIQRYIFKTDDTWEYHDVYRNGNDFIMSAGTYTGDPSKDGNLSLLETQRATYPGATLTDRDPPLDSTLTIANGKFTAGVTEYTRQ